MGSLSKIRTFNLTVAMLGTLLFAAAFAFVQFQPKAFESMVLSFATEKVQDRVSRSPQAHLATTLSERASAFLSEEQRQVAASLKAEIPEYIAAVVAAHCKCETRAELALKLRAGLEARHARLAKAMDSLAQAATNQYDAVQTELRQDVRIFLGTNLVVFLLALAACLFRAPARLHLLPICSILIASVILGSSWYIFGQDWMTTIAFNDYAGYGYSAGLGILAVLLVDILFFHACLTSALLSGISDALGAAVSFSPC
ncbi:MULTISPECIES: hypothetical protein [Kordiimonas]|uniref:hypothetical protein n=1 Tax=Kordiimonas TaxID=288021 RepID=UPI00257D55DB|nr:hypothetical protein [Kordiimonas sp. UBA4487]